jgi:hypothetical protein
MMRRAIVVISRGGGLRSSYFDFVALSCGYEACTNVSVASWG